MREEATTNANTRPCLAEYWLNGTVICYFFLENGPELFWECWRTVRSFYSICCRSTLSAPVKYMWLRLMDQVFYGFFSAFSSCSWCFCVVQWAWWLNRLREGNRTFPVITQPEVTCQDVVYLPCPGRWLCFSFFCLDTNKKQFCSRFCLGWLIFKATDGFMKTWVPKRFCWELPGHKFLLQSLFQC